jgi:serine/threonine protein kinase
MQVHITKFSEPIPGYRLLEPLGRGGFGEVWKCEAPGGLLKAIKIVHGSFDSAVGGEEPVQKELRSLNCVKSVRHPFILSLDRYDVISGQLLIVMELADRSLWDRFEECKTEGLHGIPRDELLHYMAEAAEALDLMSQRYDLQHSDVKPQNLFLIHNHVKVADFGLVRDLEGMKAAAGNGVSPLYAAPESFNGWVSRYSDQYSLAVVYQELLTGQRPFDGTNARQLLMQHVQNPPALDPLPQSDRPVVYRALRK